MEISNELNVGSREQLRAWLSENHDSCDEVWIVCCRSGRVHYLQAGRRQDVATAHSP